MRTMYPLERFLAVLHQFSCSIINSSNVIRIQAVAQSQNVGDDSESRKYCGNISYDKSGNESQDSRNNDREIDQGDLELFPARQAQFGMCVRFRRSRVMTRDSSAEFVLWE